VRTSVTIVVLQHRTSAIADTSAQFDDVKLRLDSITDLPSGAQADHLLEGFRRQPRR